MQYRTRDRLVKCDKNNLQWNIKVAILHPTKLGVTIFVGGDLGYVAKKKSNDDNLTSIPMYKQDIMLYGKSAGLKMFWDARKKTLGKSTLFRV